MRILLSFGLAALAALSVAGPRLVLDPQPMLQRSDDAVHSALGEELERQAERLLLQGTEQYQLVQGALLTRARDVVSKVVTLGVAYQKTGDSRFALRVRDEAVAVANWPDWLPQNFLGTAEVSLAMALADNWCGEAWPAADRQLVRRAIREKGLLPTLDQFALGADWLRGETNWTPVVASSMALAALAVQDDDPALSARIISRCVPLARNAHRLYGMDGLSFEGPAYWRYAIIFQSMLDRTLVNMSGPRAGLMRHSVFPKTARMPMHLQGPTGQTFNFADAGEGAVPTPAVFHLAHRTKQPAVAGWMREQVRGLVASRLPWTEERRFSALLYAWYMAGDVVDAPLDGFYGGHATVATMRENWTNPNAAWLAVKAGQNGVPHGHLDLGSFVYEANGVRWAIDLGKDRYSLPGYFDGRLNGQRWNYFRVRTESHNTLTFGNEENQGIAASARVRASLGGHTPVALVDLSLAYGFRARVLRTIGLERRRVAVITDRVQRSERSWRWSMVTEATVTLMGPVAILEQDGRRLVARLSGVPGAAFSLEAPTPGTAAENPNLGATLLTVRVPAGTNTLTVRLEPTN